MNETHFKGIVVSGHKESAVEVPFDPAHEWHATAQQIRPGRRGFAVHAQVNGSAFDSFVVGRSKKFWLLLPASVEKQAAIRTGDEVAVTLHPA